MTILLFVVALPAAFWAGSQFSEDSDSGSGRPSIGAMRKATYLRHTIEPMPQAYSAQRYSVAPASLPAYDRGLAELTARKPQVIECHYEIKGRSGTYSHEYWYGTSAPAGYEALTRVVPSGHHLRLPGVGAVTQCPKTWGEGRDLLEAYWSKLPPAPPFHRGN